MSRAHFTRVVRLARTRDDTILTTKNSDYGRDGDFLYNISSASRALGMPPRQVIAIHLLKQMSALLRYCRDGRLAGEPLETRCSDVRNYTLMLEAIATLRPQNKLLTKRQLEVLHGVRRRWRSLGARK